MQLHHTDWLHSRAITQLLTAFDAAGYPLRFVGGCVRDAVMHRPVQDIDAATPATPQQTISILEHAGIKAVPTGLAHGTITAVIDSKGYEITTLRTDLSCDGRHAEVAFTDSWEDDSNRRDFTFNAIYCDAHAQLYDFHTGIADAQAGIVRFIGDPHARIQEDALRILRYFRFLATHGKEPAHNDALSACRTHLALLDGLSGERIQHEMAKLLAADNPCAALALMLPDILPALIGPIESLEALNTLLQGEKTMGIKPDSTTRLAALLRASHNPQASCARVIERWKLSRLTTKSLEFLVSHDPIAPSALEITLKSSLRHVGRDAFARLIALSWKPDTLDVLDVALNLLRHWQIPTFPITGHDLKAHGIAEGVQMGETLRKLEALWESMDYQPDKAALLQLYFNPKSKA